MVILCNLEDILLLIFNIWVIIYRCSWKLAQGKIGRI